MSDGAHVSAEWHIPQGRVPGILQIIGGVIFMSLFIYIGVAEDKWHQVLIQGFWMFVVAGAVNILVSIETKACRYTSISCIIWNSIALCAAFAEFVLGILDFVINLGRVAFISSTVALFIGFINCFAVMIAMMVMACCIAMIVFTGKLLCCSSKAAAVGAV